MIYAIGDIHGCFGLLEEALDRIADDGEAYGLEGPDSTIVLLGDYIDRGPDSKKVIEGVRRLTQENNIVALAGNHESMMIDSVNDELNLGLWKQNGGSATLKSYGVKPNWRGPLEDQQMLEDIEWMKGLPLYHTVGQFVFVHAGIDNEVLSRNNIQSLQWSRYGQHQDNQVGDWHVVHGHTPIGVESLDRRTNLDTGAFETGVLAVGVFDEERTTLERVLYCRENR